jgi:hypothetical protein
VLPAQIDPMMPLRLQLRRSLRGGSPVRRADAPRVFVARNCSRRLCGAAKSEKVHRQYRDDLIEEK